MPDAEHGVPVWQHSWPEPVMPVLYGNRPTNKAPIREPGTWHSLSADAQQARREAVRTQISNAYYEARNADRTMEDAADDARDAVLKVLGLSEGAA